MPYFRALAAGQDPSNPANHSAKAAWVFEPALSRGTWNWSAQRELQPSVATRPSSAITAATLTAAGASRWSRPGHGHAMTNSLVALSREQLYAHDAMA